MKSFRMKSSESLNLTWSNGKKMGFFFFCCSVYNSNNYKALSCRAKFLSSVEMLHFTFLMQCQGAELLTVFLDLCFSTVLTVFKHNVFCNQFVCSIACLLKLNTWLFLPDTSSTVELSQTVLSQELKSTVRMTPSRLSEMYMKVC